jgi:tetratricopeptide (TPR) repeat protein
MRLPHAALALFALGLPAAAGDILCLKDGRVVEGPKMERKENGIELSYEHGKILIPNEMILDAVLDADAARAPATDEEKEMSSKGMVHFEGKWISAKQRDELLQKRLAARHKELEQIAARKEWRNRGQQDTAHFHFEYTVPDPIFEGYRDLMEAYYSEFARTWKLKSPGKDDRLNVSFHGDEPTFHQVSGVGYGVLGYFRFVKPWDLNIFYERMDPNFTTEVMFHEANHYLQKLIELDFGVPHFPGESLAEYYGASHWDPEKKKLTTGLILEGRLCEVQEDIVKGDFEPLDELVRTEGDYKHYTWGWSLVYFLMNDARYQPKFQKFVFTLARGKGVKREPMGIANLNTVKGEEVFRVFREELGLKDATAVRALEKEWYAYVQQLQPATLEGLEKAGMSAAGNGRPIRAKRMLKDAIAKGSRNPLVHARYAELLGADAGQRLAAIEAWKKALEIDPLNGKFYASLGHTMLYGKKEDPSNAEANRMIALGKDLGYDDPWVAIDLGKPDEKP